jgi:predicted ATPase
MTNTLFTGLRLRNFRAFSDPVNVPLGQITLLYGQNSAGKSSILKALLMLQQTFRDNPNRRSADIVFSGEAVDLGSFATTVFNHDSTKIMEVGVEFELGDIPEDQPGRRSRFATGGFSWSVSSQSGVERTQFSLGDSTFCFQKRTIDRRPLFVLDPNDVTKWCDFVAGSRDLFSASDPILSDLMGNEGFLPVFAGGIIPERLLGCARLPQASENLISRVDIPLKRYDRADDDDESSVPSRYVSRNWMNDARVVSRQLRSFLRDLSHLGPLRQEPTRLERYVPTSGRYVGANGAEMLSLMYDQPSLVTQVNNYLGLMNLPYRLQVTSLGDRNTVGTIISLELRNVKTGLELSPTDVGVGYSQVLPLITQSVLSRDSLICVEQPELHLHPAMQARLADVFIGQALSGHNVQFLIETHSESLMLRILRRVREGSIPTDLVRVLYVDQTTSGESKIVELPILPSGDFEIPWPNGFFDERLEEYGL